MQAFLGRSTHACTHTLNMPFLHASFMSFHTWVKYSTQLFRACAQPLGPHKQDCSHSPNLSTHKNSSALDWALAKSPIILAWILSIYHLYVSHVGTPVLFSQSKSSLLWFEEFWGDHSAEIGRFLASSGKLWLQDGNWEASEGHQVPLTQAYSMVLQTLLLARYQFLYLIMESMIMDSWLSMKEESYQNYVQIYLQMRVKLSWKSQRAEPLSSFWLFYQVLAHPGLLQDAHCRAAKMAKKSPLLKLQHWPCPPEDQEEHLNKTSNLMVVPAQLVLTQHMLLIFLIIGVPNATSQWVCGSCI
jgi:hypothetical protein